MVHSLEEKIFEEIYEVGHFVHVTRTSFAIPVTSHERNIASKFQPDRTCGLAGEVKKGEGRTNDA